MKRKCMAHSSDFCQLHSERHADFQLMLSISLGKIFSDVEVGVQVQKPGEPA